MEGEQGIVVEITGDQIIVECDPHDMCISCSAKKGCMTAESGKVRRVSMDNRINAAVGDIVLFTIDSSGIVAASLVIYIVPVILLFAGLFAGSRFHEYLMLDKDGASAIMGVLLFFLSFFLIKFFSVFTQNKAIFQPKAVKIIKRGQ